MSDPAPPTTPLSQLLQSRNGLILITGFAVGLCVGGLVLFGGSDPAGSQVPEKFAARRQPEGTTAQESPATDLLDQQAPSGLVDRREQLAAELETLKLQQEIAALKRELAAAGTSPVSAPAASPPVASEQPAPASGPSTLNYWNRMNDVIEQEGRMRAAPLGGITSMNARGFLDARIRAAGFAADALRALDTDGVDPRAVSVADAVAQWFADGQTVAETGLDLLTRGSTDQRKGAAGQQYQAAERQHSQAVNDVNAEGERVRQQLAREYGLSFPPLK